LNECFQPGRNATPRQSFPAWNSREQTDAG
jgi:hypothetical protein